MPSFRRICALCALLPALALAQRRIPPQLMYERIYLILPMQGQGTWDDPKRPLFLPPPDQMQSSDRSGILAYHYQVSDDG